jgi:hypothetical protein
MAELTCISTLTYEADNRLLQLHEYSRDLIIFPFKKRAKSFTTVNFYFTSSIRHLPFHIVCAGCLPPASHICCCVPFHAKGYVSVLVALSDILCSRFIQEQ